MTVRLSLPLKILLLTAVNLLLIAVALGVFARVKYGADLSGTVFRMSEDRLSGIGRTVALELRSLPASGRDEMLRRLEAQYQASFYLFENDGTQIAGDSVPLPEPVLQRLRGPAGARGGGPPPRLPPGAG
ncbi:MAG: hypothetical protein SGI92_06315, partial [Bryobacteraceae bacterium]|nr:hypothetical protein [Bryobacteraceae bacterium]